ncbi:unnamed protein product [Didymodactylos carnosus]|uniref:Pex N-terminal domain-containing protein n=1 Tax=Didymodactylos carnosus TaxID=1234261 RepID=A0A813ZXD3_9BILA|nr:unnamed protein product [Didymodactylos carnosus]CAF0904608.1 unnamed protein product [Didymodactylos carnosus]CAF3496939.1 unnamed protein product [Didymodactylos carnosus]CAF3686510.1 unnamed protein product [Didymodactylos carnosus]
MSTTDHTSNINSTLNFSTISQNPLPSIFELLAQERLTYLLRPCLSQLIKFLHDLRPLSKSFMLLYRYKDECVLLIETLIQSVYLQTYSSLIGEHFYGLKRSSNHHIRSLIFSVFLPYIKQKLELLYEKYRQQTGTQEEKKTKLKQFFFFFVLKFVPKIHTFLESLCWLYRLGYAFGRIEYYSPFLQLAGVKLTYDNKKQEQQQQIQNSSKVMQTFHFFSQTLSTGLFLIQFLEWWNSTSNTRKQTSLNDSIPPPPTVSNNTIAKRQCPLCKNQYDSPELLFLTFLYLLFSFIIVFPPNELVAAGFSIQNVFSFLLDSEEIAFIRFHIKRVSLKIFFQSLLPIGYVILLISQYNLNNGLINTLESLFSDINIIFQCIIILSLFIPFVVIITLIRWHQNDCYTHPIVRQLRAFAQETDTWHAVESSINTEFRRIDKFICGTPNNRSYVLDSWIIKCGLYNVYIAQQSNAHIELTDANDVNLQENETITTQYLNILVRSGNPLVTPFTIRLKASEFNDLRSKLQSPVQNARNIVIRQSLSDLFLEDFRRHIANNPKYRYPPNQQELETCIGCLVNNANVKLMKRCDVGDNGQCRTCFCKPMWCIECLGKWFASRQDQTRPETWLSSTYVCPVEF